MTRRPFAWRKQLIRVFFALFLFVPSYAQADVFRGLLQSSPDFLHIDTDRSAFEFNPIFFRHETPAQRSIHTSATAMVQAHFQRLQGPTNEPEFDLWCESQLGLDKFKHMVLSFFVTLSFQYILETKLSVPKPVAFIVSATAMTLLGVAREYDDWNNPDKHCFSTVDIIANTAGILGSAVVVFKF